MGLSRLCPIFGHRAAGLAQARSGRTSLMKDEARVTGLDPARDRAQADRINADRAQRYGQQAGRGSPQDHARFGHARPDMRADASGAGADLYGPTYAALDLGTNNCRLL